MNDGLQNTLRHLMRSGWHANPAMRSIIDDYARYHAILLITCGLIAVAFLVASVVLWRRFRMMAREKSSGSSYERRVYVGFAASSALAGVVIGLLAMVNATNAFAPLNGFSGVVDALGPHDGPLHQSFNQWLNSGASTPPPLVAAELHHRVQFQGTKAAVCTLLLVAFALLGARLWRTSVRWSRRDRATARPGRLLRAATTASGVVTVGLAMLMLVVVVANLQGALAPTTLTLLYGSITPGS